MQSAYFRHLGIFSLLTAVLFFAVFKDPSLKWLAGVAYGNLIFVFNIVLFVFVFSAASNKLMQPKKSFLHRLSLLLAISIKGFNLLLLTYLGMSALKLGPLPIVAGAMVGLIAHVVFFMFYFFLTNDLPGQDCLQSEKVAARRNPF